MKVVYGFYVALVCCIPLCATEMSPPVKPQWFSELGYSLDESRWNKSWFEYGEKLLKEAHNARTKISRIADPKTPKRTTPGFLTTLALYEAALYAYQMAAYEKRDPNAFAADIFSVRYALSTLKRWGMSD